MSINGGATLTEKNALTVIPRGPPSPDAVTTLTDCGDVPHEGTKPFGGVHHSVQEEDEESGASENSAV